MVAHDEVLALPRRTTAWQRFLRTRGRWARYLPIGTVVGLLLGITAAGLALQALPRHAPFATFSLLAVLAGLFLAPRVLGGVYGYLMVWVAYTLSQTPASRPAVVGASLVLAAIMGIMYWVASSRARLGVQGTLGENMLVDLRDRLRTQGELPELPPEWAAEQAVLSAYGDSFSGDFLVTSKTGDILELVLVDVSGKGAAAGTRSLLLSGAFGGLLGSMPYDQFLPAANSYLLRQHWDEGFATAAHVMINLFTGEFSLGSAGHPPGVRFSAGSGRWEVLEGEEGPVLGVTEAPDFPRTNGTLGRGDALLLYTDGVIETRNRDLVDGIDRMLGTAEGMISRGFEGMAEKMCAAARAGETDDRATVLVWRR